MPESAPLPAGPLFRAVPGAGGGCLLAQLRPGWALDEAGLTEGRRVRPLPALPPGWRLEPALSWPPAGPGGAAWPAEIELARWLRLLPPGPAAAETVAAALLAVADWPAVAQVQWVDTGAAPPPRA